MISCLDLWVMMIVDSICISYSIIPNLLAYKSHQYWVWDCCLLVIRAMNSNLESYQSHKLLLLVCLLRCNLKSNLLKVYVDNNKKENKIYIKQVRTLKTCSSTYSGLCRSIFLCCFWEVQKQNRAIKISLPIFISIHQGEDWQDPLEIKEKSKGKLLG